MHMVSLHPCSTGSFCKTFETSLGDNGHVPWTTGEHRKMRPHGKSAYPPGSNTACPCARYLDIDGAPGAPAETMHQMVSVYTWPAGKGHDTARDLELKLGSWRIPQSTALSCRSISTRETCLMRSRPMLSQVYDTLGTLTAVEPDNGKGSSMQETPNALRTVCGCSDV